MLLSLLLAIAPDPRPDCRHDRAALLAMSEEAFDQDLTGGWRSLDQRDCLAEAADLLRDYRNAAPRKDPQILAWHEGQERGYLGQKDAAVALFRQTYRPAATDKSGWNFYVDGTIAFIEGDLQGLQSARAKLASLPRPKREQVFIYKGRRIPMAWPPNLNVLDGLIKCFGHPYREAYESEACVKPSGKIEI